MPQDIGDAVLTFLGDSTDLDTKFDQVQPKAKKAFDEGADEVERGSRRMGESMREARGETALLGEAFGIHLPRHVRNFLAELPGVSSAMSAAFSATAVLFLANAVVDVSKKLSEFVSSHLIFTEAMKESDKQIVTYNQHLIEQAEAYKKNKDAIDSFGASGTDALRLQLNLLQQQIAAKQKSVDEGIEENQQQRNVTHEYITQHGYLSKGYDLIKSWVTGGKTQLDTIKGQTAEIQSRVNLDFETVKALKEQQALLEKQLETEHKLDEVKQRKQVQSASLNAQRASAEAAVSLDSQTAEKRQAIKEHFEDLQYKLERSSLNQQLAVLKENGENTKDAQGRIYAELQAMAFKHEAVLSERQTKAKDELLKTLNDMAKGIQAAPTPDIVPPSTVQNLLKFISTAHQAGIVLRQDLVQGVRTAQRAMDEFSATGQKDQAQWKVLVNNLHLAQKALNSFGMDEEKFRIRTEATWKNFVFELHNGANAMVNLSQLGKEAFDSMALGLQGAIATAILAQGSFTQELEKATASALASLASQAIVKALFYTAEGFAALAGFEHTSAGQYFAAAGEMAAVGAAAGLAAHAMNGGGGGGGNSNTQQTFGGISNTTQSNRSVPHLAEGGLITGPTLALLGEDRKRPTEAVMNLDDPRAMRKVGQAISENGGGGNGVHFHLPQGMIVTDHTLQKLAGKLSKAVSQGRVQLTASNSLRVTKRSA
jgi:hypothetical protein